MKKYTMNWWDKVMAGVLKSMDIERIKAIVKVAKPGYHVAQNPDRKKAE